MQNCLQAIVHHVQATNVLGNVVDGVTRAQALQEPGMLVVYPP